MTAKYRKKANKSALKSKRQMKKETKEEVKAEHAALESKAKPGSSEYLSRQLKQAKSARQE